MHYLTRQIAWEVINIKHLIKGERVMMRSQALQDNQEKVKEICVKYAELMLDCVREEDIDAKLNDIEENPQNYFGEEQFVPVKIPFSATDDNVKVILDFKERKWSCVFVKTHKTHDQNGKEISPKYYLIDDKFEIESAIFPESDHASKEVVLEEVIAELTRLKAQYSYN